MRLLAAIVSEETDLPNTDALKGLNKAANKIVQLADTVEAAWQAMTTRKQAQPDPGNFYQYVLLAPEYFFSNQRYVNDRFFQHDVKRYIIRELAALAGRYPELLIVPGTVLWTKNAYKAPPVKIGSRSPNVSYSVDASRVDKTYARMQSARAQFPSVPTNEPEWSHRGPYDGQEDKFDIAYSYLKQADRLKTKIAQNVAYVCLGTTLLKYHKIGNYKEVEGESDTIVFASGNIVGRFKLGDVKYALEICIDHNIGVVAQTTAPNDEPHVRLIVSSYVDHEKASTLNNLVVLHSSTQKAGYDGPVRASTDPVRLRQNVGSKLLGWRDATPTCRVYDIEIDHARWGIGKSALALSSPSLEAVKHIR